MTAATTLSPRASPIAIARSSASADRWSPDRLFPLWLLARTLLWTLVATLSQQVPPLDTVEWLCWGREWQLGYYKHPPLAAWVADVAFRLAGGSFFGVYLAGYVAVAVALWCVWRLARTMLPPRPALAATVCLDGLVFFQYAAAEFNNQVLLIAFWALAIWLFHRALTGDRLRDWIGTGAALGMALLCKYSAVFLIVPLLGLWLWRNGLRRPSRPMIVALTAAVVFLPHFVWLCQHDFPTLRYAALRAAGDSETFDHRLSALMFVLSQGARLLPVAVVLGPLIRRRAAGNPFPQPTKNPSPRPPPRSGEGEEDNPSPGPLPEAKRGRRTTPPPSPLPEAEWGRRTTPPPGPLPGAERGSRKAAALARLQLPFSPLSASGRGAGGEGFFPPTVPSSPLSSWDPWRCTWRRRWCWG